MTRTGTHKWFKSSYSDGGGGGNCLEVAYDWRESSYGDGGGNCVEVALRPRAIPIHDSKNPGSPDLTVSGEAWAGFLAGQLYFRQS